MTERSGGNGSGPGAGVPPSTGGPIGGAGRGGPAGVGAPGPAAAAGRPAMPAGPGGRPMGRPGGGPGMFGMGMGLPPQKSKDFRGSLRRLFGHLRPEAPRLAAVFALAVVSVFIQVIGPRIIGNAFDLIVEGTVSKSMPAGATQQQIVEGLRAGGDTRLADMLSGMHLHPGTGIEFGVLGGILATLIALYLASAVFNWGQAFLMAGVSQRTVYRLRLDVDEKLGRLPLRYFDSVPRGDLLSRVTNDIDNIGQSLQQSLSQLIPSLLTIVGMLILMLTISPVLAAISILAVPASLAVTMLIVRRSQQQFVAQWSSTGALNGHVEEMHTGHAIVKAFGRQREAIERFDEENERLYDASRRAQFISGIIQPALSFISNLNYVAIAVIGGLRVAAGQMSIGDVVAFIQYSRQFTFPILQVAGVVNVLQSAVASAERVFELLDEKEEKPDPKGAPAFREPSGAVVFDDVSFRYEPDRPLIEGLDLTVPAGATVAIVGPTGAGKTTLVNLLMRFYEIESGRITIDGIDTRDLQRDALRRAFGMVLQDTWLFHGTIRENIAYGRLDATDDEVHDASEAAHVEHFVRTLPDGYETVIDDDATTVSAGEKQLLTIARAFLADPPILILDEATSSVDTRTEVLIQRAMARLMKGRTTFVIAHRLSTIRDADTILVMERGSIVEQGTHDELLARGGAYADLYQSQFAEPLAEAV
ncbi:MAG TPA: ABC transporter ATP-binding protein [Candidatus Limnocylindrales bacterium]|nr:ABC transporter ATP-binding protein [Candidatus Limnocylindrales bacterium]